MPVQATLNPFSRYAYRVEREAYLGKRWSEVNKRSNPLSRISGLVGYGLERCTLYNPIGCRVMDGVRGLFTWTSRESNGEIKKVRPRLTGLIGLPLLAGGAAAAGVIYRDQIAQGVTDAANVVADNFNEHVVPVWDQVSSAVADNAPKVIDAVKEGAEVVADGFTSYFGESTATLAGGAAGVTLAPLMVAKLAHKHMSARNDMRRLHRVVNDLTQSKVQEGTQVEGQKIYKVSLSTLRRLEKIRNLDRTDSYSLNIVPAGGSPNLESMADNAIAISNTASGGWKGITLFIKDDRGNVLKVSPGKGLSNRLAKKINKMAYYGGQPYHYVKTEKLTNMIVGGLGLSDKGRGFIAKALLGPRVGAYKNMNFLVKTLHHIKDIVMAPVNLTALALHSTGKMIGQCWTDDKDIVIGESALRNHLEFIHNKLERIEPATSAFEGAACGGAIAAAAGAVSLGLMAIPVFVGAVGAGAGVSWTVNAMANREANSMRNLVGETLEQFETLRNDGPREEVSAESAAAEGGDQQGEAAARGGGAQEAA